MDLNEWLHEAIRINGFKSLSLSVSVIETEHPDRANEAEIALHAKLYPLDSSGAGRTAEFQLDARQVAALSDMVGQMQVGKFDKGKKKNKKIS